MNIIFDLYQQSQIAAARAKADQAKNEGERLRFQIDDLQRKADALTIACQALWEIVRDQRGISDEVILAKMREIDLRDGVADGKISATLASCPSCKRQCNSARKTCLYCGAALPIGHVFSKA